MQKKNQIEKSLIHARVSKQRSCPYYIGYKDLHLFLKGHLKNDFIFSEDLLNF